MLALPSVGVILAGQVHRHLAQYLLELGLLDIRMLRFTASHVVSAALLLSNELLGRCRSVAHTQKPQRDE
jgi:hypothetical protein